MNSDHQNYDFPSQDPNCCVLIPDDDGSSSSDSSLPIIPSPSEKRGTLSSNDDSSPLVLIPPSPEESDSSSDSQSSGIIQEGTFDPSRLGKRYQATIPTLQAKPSNISHKDKKRAGTQVWASSQLSNRKIDEYFNSVARYCTKEKALDILHRYNYDVSAARGYILENCHNVEFLSEDEKWTPEERETFDDGLCLYGKNLRKIHTLLPHKQYGELVNYYYRNKRRKSVYSHKYFYDRVSPESVNEFIFMNDDDDDDSSRGSVFMQDDIPCSPTSSALSSPLLSSSSSLSPSPSHSSLPLSSSSPSLSPSPSPSPSPPPTSYPGSTQVGVFQQNDNEFLASDTAFNLEKPNPDLSSSLLMDSSNSVVNSQSSTTGFSLWDTTWDNDRINNNNNNTNAQRHECNFSKSNSNEDRLFTLVNQL